MCGGGKCVNMYVCAWVCNAGVNVCALVCVWARAQPWVLWLVQGDGASPAHEPWLLSDHSSLIPGRLHSPRKTSLKLSSARTQGPVPPSLTPSPLISSPN